VEDFILRWKVCCARLIIQYATEKMTPEQKNYIRRQSDNPFEIH